MIPNIFDNQVTEGLVTRINRLQPDAPAIWGKMTVAQMLAHCCVSYDITLGNRQIQPNGLRKLLLKWFVKPMVTGKKPYRKNSPTAPEFVIRETKDFDREKQRLIDFLRRVQSLGAAHFDRKVYPSFGKLTREEWSNMWYKHLDHHLRQFGQ